MEEMIKLDSSNISYIKINRMEIIENIVGEDYDYTCSYDIDIQFTEIETGDRKLDEYLNTKVLKDSKDLQATFKERPKELLSSGAVTKQDVEEAKEIPEIINSAIQDFIDQNKDSKPGILINLVKDIFNYDIPNRVFQSVVYDSKVELVDTKRVKRVEYNYRKKSIKRVSIFYDDDTVTVDLKHEVTDKDVDNVIPGESLVTLYLFQEDWFEEDYEKTLEMMNNIFGFNLETLKGANIVW